MQIPWRGNYNYQRYKIFGVIWTPILLPVVREMIVHPQSIAYGAMYYKQRIEKLDAQIKKSMERTKNV